MRTAPSNPIHISRPTNIAPFFIAAEEPAFYRHNELFLNSTPDAEPASPPALSSSIEAASPPSPCLRMTPICSTPLDLGAPHGHEADHSVVEPRPQQRQAQISSVLLKEYLATEHEPRYGFLTEVQDGEISALVRAELYLWLQELIEFHECESAVFVCAADLMDRLLSSIKLRAKHLRVAAVACFFIAAKCLLEEADQPIASDLVANCHGEFSLNDLKRMELVVLDKLHWQVPARSSVSMLQNMANFACAELAIKPDLLSEVMHTCTSNYVACVISYELLRFTPSVVAAALLVDQLSPLTSLSLAYLRSLFASELGVSAREIEDCQQLVARHLRVAAAMFQAAK